MTRLLSCILLIGVVVSSCAQAQRAPEAAVDRELHDRREVLDSGQIRTLEIARQQGVTEMLRVQDETAVRRPDEPWLFSPEFLLDAAPDNAMDRMRNAIFLNDANAFCTVAARHDECLELFASSPEALAGAYTSETSDYTWKTTDSGLATTLGDLTFSFERLGGIWQFTGVCSVVPDLARAIPRCRQAN